MSNLLRVLALVCLALGFVSAADAAASGLHTLEAGLWVLLELVLIWLNLRISGATGARRNRYVDASDAGAEAHRPARTTQSSRRVMPTAHT